MINEADFVTVAVRVQPSFLILETWRVAQSRPGGDMRPGAGIPDSQHHRWLGGAEPQPRPGLSYDRSLPAFRGILLMNKSDVFCEIFHFQ